MIRPVTDFMFISKLSSKQFPKNKKDLMTFFVQAKIWFCSTKAKLIMFFYFSVTDSSK